MRGAALTVFGLLSAAAAHSEVVTVTTLLSPLGPDLHADAQLLGRTSGLPIRGAHVELALSRERPADRRTGGTSGERPRADTLVGRVPLTQGDSGHYVGTLPRVAGGTYVVTIIDTTYRGETTTAARTVTLGGRPAQVTVDLPATRTPGRYLLYALLGIFVPFLIPVVAILRSNRQSRAQRQG